MVVRRNVGAMSTTTSGHSRTVITTNHAVGCPGGCGNTCPIPAGMPRIARITRVTQR